MSRYLSTIVTLLLLLGLGALALVALSGTASNTMAAVTDLSSTAPGAQGDGELDAAAALAPDALSSTTAWNAIAIPLNPGAAMVNAQDLADAINGVQQVLRWNANTQTFAFYIPDPVFSGGLGTNFNLTVGGAYFVLLDSTASTTFTIVGDVPPQTGEAGAVEFSLVGGAPCKWNFISVPLDQDAVDKAQALADAIADVDQVLRWNVDTQTYQFYIPDPVFPDGLGANFDVQIGYPYFVCLSDAKTWPQ